jgi:hypothetical protein
MTELGQIPIIVLWTQFLKAVAEAAALPKLGVRGFWGDPKWCKYQYLWQKERQGQDCFLHTPSWPLVPATPFLNDKHVVT